MTDRTVIITGGFGVLGRAMAQAFLDQGYRVARIDLAEAAPTTIDGVHDLGGVDLTQADAANRAVADVVARFGLVDVLVNVAGGFLWQTLADGAVDAWTRLFALNATTCVNMTKAALPELVKQKGARIINIGANGALNAGAGMGAYAASKAAVHKLTESLAAELAAEDITVNAILPSIIDTPANRADMPDADYRQWISPVAIADAALLLASPAARGISGVLIPVTKG